ncbi:MAG: diguanylate cyclase [Oxalobacter sp.]|nr:MAG: diguanylate cyclase [Oxalobacter sp.]
MTDSHILWRLLFILPNLLAAFGMCCVGAVAWRYRRHRGGLALLIFAIGVFLWTFFEALNFLGLSQEWVLFFWRMEALGVSIAPLAIVVAVIDYFGYGHFLTRRRIVILSIVPALEMMASVTSPWHEWVWQAIRVDHSWPFPILVNTPGPVSWVCFGYGSLLLFASMCFLLLRQHELQRPQQYQVYMVVAAMLIPMLATAFYVGRISPLPNTSLTTMSFILSGILLMCGIYRNRMFDLAPVTAYEIYRSLDDAVFVLNRAHRVLDLNAAAESMLGIAMSDSVGRVLSELLPQAKDLLESESLEQRIEVQWHGQWYDVRLTALDSLDGRFSSRLMVWRDVTARKRLEAELTRQAVTDELTGLYNRRHFFARGAEEIEHARRYERPLSVMMIDIDRFKAVNDRYGHEGGDCALVVLTNILISELRFVDCIARIGGEEFAMLLPETNAEAAHEVARRLISKVASTEIALPQSEKTNITISVGLVTLNAMTEDMSMSTLLRRADDALFLAKDAGRNRLVHI